MCQIKFKLAPSSKTDFGSLKNLIYTEVTMISRLDIDFYHISPEVVKMH